MTDIEIAKQEVFTLLEHLDLFPSWKFTWDTKFPELNSSNKKLKLSLPFISLELYTIYQLLIQCTSIYKNLKFHLKLDMHEAI